ncbi:MAG: DNA-directed RNA polymerase sigma-70 factor [Dehalococcoidia bacterium]|nr:MAG: DNA-directed RNA polymerase sigma-70 factor [Dehalococcoidia bacterium]
MGKDQLAWPRARLASALVSEQGGPISPERQDAELIARFQSRDLAALEQFYDRHQAVAFGLALRILGDRGAAEEVVQEAFLAAWRRADTFNPARGSARGWLLGIVRNRAIDLLRQRAGAPPTAPIEAAFQAAARTDVFAEVSQTLDAEAIRRALERLPSEQRETIEYTYFKGMSCSEVAAQMNVPVGTVKGRLRLALKKLRASLAPMPE